MGGQGEWRDCDVVGYSEEASLFKVRWPEGGAVAGGDVATAVSSDGYSEVSRLDVCFLSEDPVNFARRVGVAHKYVLVAVWVVGFGCGRQRNDSGNT